MSFHPAGPHQPCIQARYLADRDDSLTTSSFAPAVDVYEAQVNLKIDVPGIDEKDIDVRVEGHTVTGELVEGREEASNATTATSPTFTLPQTVNTETVSATYDKGVLKIALPKKAEAKPKQIKVTVSSEKTVEAKSPTKAA